MRTISPSRASIGWKISIHFYWTRNLKTWRHKVLFKVTNHGIFIKLIGMLARTRAKENGLTFSIKCKKLINNKSAMNKPINSSNKIKTKSIYKNKFKKSNNFKLSKIMKKKSSLIIGILIWKCMMNNNRRKKIKSYMIKNCKNSKWNSFKWKIEYAKKLSRKQIKY